MSLFSGGASFSVYACDPFGVRLGDMSAFTALKYSRVTNDVGVMKITMPTTGRRAFDTSLLRVPDGRIEIWRRLPGSAREYLDTETIWLIKKTTRARDDRGRETITIEADTPLCVLREPGRFVNWAGTTSQAEKTDRADDMLKEIAAENIGNSSTPQRDLSALITIAPDLGLAPSISKAFAWRSVLKTMQEIADASAQAGAYLAFDIVAPTSSTLQFRTYVQQRGVDHRYPGSVNPVIISPDFGNIGACTLSQDWRGEITYALAGGRGDGIFRLTAEAQDDARIGASPFGLREQFVTATQYTTTTGLAAEAEAVVRNGRARTLFQGKILDVPDTRYGVHWGWGDFVTVQAFGRSFDARIDAVTVSVERGKETIDAWVRGDL